MIMFVLNDETLSSVVSLYKRILFSTRNETGRKGSKTRQWASLKPRLDVT